MVMPGLADLINKKKDGRVKCKIQLNMGANLFLLMIQEKCVLFMGGVIMKKLY